MPIIDTESVPWDLSLKVRGAVYATCKPAWKDVLELERIERAMAAGRQAGVANPPELEADLRGALAAFFPPALREQLLAGLEYDELMAAMAAASAYFGAWLKKKRDRAQADAEALLAPPPPIPAPAASKAPGKS